MTDQNGSSLTGTFQQRWDSIMDRWTSSPEKDSSFPSLTKRQKALLGQIRPEVLAGNYMILATSSRMAREEAETKMREHIHNVFSRELGIPVQFSINIKSDDEMEPLLRHTEHTHEDHQDELAEEHARGYRPRMDAVDREPSPNPSNWGHMVSPSLARPEQSSAQRRDTHPAHGTHSSGVEVAQKHDGSRALFPNHNSPETMSSPHPHQAGTGPSAPEGTQHSTDSSGGENMLINSAYTFENFVTGSSNQLAYAACRAVAEYPGAAYNPLLVWGESGLGKTHLLHAIAHYARELRPKSRIKYVSSEELTNDFINSISTGAREDFKRRYRNLDLLIVDDTQFLQGKESTQEEFFHTFNALHQAGKQIVLSSDRPPHQLTTLEDRLRTRFESGLISDVQSPDLETRMAILSRKAESRNLQLPQDVKELIATRYQNSIRELEGALTRVIAYCSLGHQPLTLQSAEAALRDIMPDDGDTEITPQLVIDVVAEFYDLSASEIIGKGRARQIANARQIGMYLCRELTDLSLPKLGAAFGGRDHTTVMYAERRINDKIQEDHKTFNQVQELTQRIKARARN
ncbi:chromosomal replication initiator protein DnaA [Corynebacterium anserum]|uniref:Chromosomal replication initiator protein DnaA n=1 Tax=Corynebacterium anserum TaxID=2684406 RepID=A0A7G7YLD4_9CORY|nr:chromosomal replication initiator protein DnaA [Corynebacterium anserum]